MAGLRLPWLPDDTAFMVLYTEVCDCTAAVAARSHMLFPALNMLHHLQWVLAESATGTPWCDILQSEKCLLDVLDTAEISWVDAEWLRQWHDANCGDNTLAAPTHYPAPTF